VIGQGARSKREGLADESTASSPTPMPTNPVPLATNVLGLVWQGLPLTITRPDVASGTMRRMAAAPNFSLDRLRRQPVWTRSAFQREAKVRFQPIADTSVVAKRLPTHVPCCR